MNKFFSQLKKETHGIQLTSKEREVMRHALESAMRSGSLVKSPIRLTRSPYLFISSKLVSPLAFALVVAVIGGGTAYAAEAAVPGELLYTFKVQVNEKVAEVLAISSEAKAEVHTKLAERRMKEAEVLTSRGELTTEAKTELETRLEDHAARVDSEVEVIEREDPVAAADISSRFESALAAHSALIERLGEEVEDETSRRESVRLAAALKERGKRLARGGAVSITAERSVSGDIAVQTFVKSDESAITASIVLEANDDPVAVRIGESASSTLEEAEARFNAFEKNLNATTAERVKKQLQKTRELIKNLHGKDKEVYEKALKDAKTLKVFIEAQEKFEQRELLPTLEIGEEEGGR
ncbi:hypothetical protein HYW60_04010 [Candidatus Kaiserbacteria bacterium]|nr:hypothetical protein [Candidatus Kaiserbacteria bacterium]